MRCMWPKASTWKAPLRDPYIAIENGNWNSEFSQLQNWNMLVYQRVNHNPFLGDFFLMDILGLWRMWSNMLPAMTPTFPAIFEQDWWLIKATPIGYTVPIPFSDKPMPCVGFICILYMILYIHTCIKKNTYAYMYIYTHTYAYIKTYVYIYIHMHTYTYKYRHAYVCV